MRHAQAKKEDNDLSELRDAALEGGATDAHLMAKASEGSGNKMLDCVMTSLNEEKAEEIVSISLAGKSEIADHMVVASGRSSRQVAAISEKLVEALKANLGVICRVEGKDAGDWVLALHKLGHRWPWVRQTLERRGQLQDALFAQRLGWDDQVLAPASQVPPTQRPYFSLLLIRRGWPAVLP